MAERLGPRLRSVGPDEKPRRRRPGPAVVAVLLYALLFGAALWYLRAKSPLFQKTRPVPTAQQPAARLDAGAGRGVRPPAPKASRSALLSGDGVEPRSRARYFQRLAVEHCDCGCERTLSDCLANETKCSRSPVLADTLRRETR